MILKQIVFFLIIGVATILIDYLTYMFLVFFISNIGVAKSIGFIIGSIFSFRVNRDITFNVKNHSISHLSKFTLLYFASMIINVFANFFLLDLFTNSNLKVQVSFTLATFISATINFVGMKFIVFK